MVPPLTDLQHLRTQAKKVMLYSRTLMRQADIFPDVPILPTDMHQLSGLRLLSHLQFR